MPCKRNLLEVAGFVAPLRMTSHVAIERSRYRSNQKHQLMPKVPHTGEYHCHFTLVSCGNHFFIANRPAWLNSTRCAGFGGSDQPVWERKKSVARDRAALERKPGLVRLPDRDPRSVNSRHLASADSKCPVRLGIHNGVGFHVCEDAPSE